MSATYHDNRTREDVDRWQEACIEALRKENARLKAELERIKSARLEELILVPQKAVRA